MRFTRKYCLNSNNLYFVDLDIRTVKYLIVRTKEFKGKVYFFLNYVHDPIALVKSLLKRWAHPANSS